VECESNSDNSNKKGNWNNLKITLRQYLRNIREKNEIKELQKTATLGTAHTVQKVLT